jgi:hypothetical protein
LGKLAKQKKRQKNVIKKNQWSAIFI